nr:IMD [Portunus trituberculatus]
MNNLTTDSVPLGRRPSCEETDDRQERPLPGPTPRLCQVPQIVNITGSKDVVIGPVYHKSAPRPRPPPDPRHTPTRRQVDALLRCDREVAGREIALVAEHVGASWTSLGRAMGFSGGQLDNITEDFPRSADRCFELLQRWHDREAERATVAVLTKFLLDSKALAAVKQLNP